MGRGEGAFGEPLGLMAMAAVAAISFSLFILTSAPVVMWGDSAKLTLMAMDLELLPNPGGHPGYVLLAGLLLKLIPGDPARMLNLFSGVCGGLTVVVLARLTSEVAGRMGGVVAAAALLVAHLFWYSATIAESYTPAALALSLIFLLAHWFSRRPFLPLLLGISFLIPFGASLNGIVGILTPSVLVYMGWELRKPDGRGRRMRAPWHWIPLAVGAFVVGSFPFLLAATREGGLWELPQYWLREASGYLSLTELRREGLRYPLYLLYQFPSPAILLLPLGIRISWKKGGSLGVAILAAWIMDILFGAAWLRQRQFMIFSAGLLFPAFFIGLGFRALFEGPWGPARDGGRNPLHGRVPRPGRVSLRFAGLVAAILLMPVGVYLITPPLAEKMGIELTGARAIPYRPETFFLRPWKLKNRGPEAFAGDLFSQAGPRDRVVADFTLYKVLSYYQRTGEGAGVELLSTGPANQRRDPAELVAWIEEGLDQGVDVFLADGHPGYYFLAALEDRFTLEPRGMFVGVR